MKYILKYIIIRLKTELHFIHVRLRTELDDVPFTFSRLPNHTPFTFTNEHFAHACQRTYLLLLLFMFL